jgi:murein DD-endopeptidase MepM/ murein hydrolase activator NlpD
MATTKKTSDTWKRWKDRYRFQIVEEESYDVKFVIVLNPLNLLVVMSVGAIVLMGITYLLIALTPLRQYIPGYGDVDAQRELTRFAYRIQTLEGKLKAHERFSENLSNILNDMPPLGDTTMHTMQTNPQQARAALDKASKQDSIFRKQVEERDRFAIVENIDAGTGTDLPGKDYFFTPLKGRISRIPGKPLLVLAGSGKPVMAISDGHVVSTSVELGKGQTIVIQHPYDYISIYRSLENMSIKVGIFVHAGHLLAYTGKEGKLEFELWYKGQPLDPTTYINFE